MSPQYEIFQQPKNWLITGGAGFLGINFVHELLAQGVLPENIRIVDNLLGNKFEILKNHQIFTEPELDWGGGAIGLFLRDIAQFDGLEHAIAGADIVVHLAAKTSVPLSVDNPLIDFRSNTIGTFNVLEAARQSGVAHTLFTSSIAGYALGETKVTETSVANPISPYGASKLAGEMMVQAWAQSYGMQCNIFRLSNAIGPRFTKNDGLIPRMIRKAHLGETLMVYGDGSATRDFIYCTDIFNAFFASLDMAMTSGRSELFQIASNTNHTVNEAIEIFNTVLESRGMRPLKHQYQPVRQGDIIESYCDHSKARKLLDWHPHISFKDGLQQALDWYLDAGS